MVGRLTEARRQGAAGGAAVREALTAQRALKAVWFQQVPWPPTCDAPPGCKRSVTLLGMQCTHEPPVRAGPPAARQEMQQGGSCVLHGTRQHSGCTTADAPLHLQLCGP